MNESQKKKRPGNYWNSPVFKTADGLYGNSHAWGDVSSDVRNNVIGKIISSAKRDGLDVQDTAHILAFVNFPESGFNPSAATKPGKTERDTTSAAGLGQFTNATRDYYRLSDEKMWDVQSQIDALNKAYVKSKDRAVSHVKTAQAGNLNEFIYAYYHDGLGERNIEHNKKKGIEISRAQVMPGVPAWEEIVRRWDDGIKVTDIKNYNLPGKSGRTGFTIHVTNQSAGPGSAFTVNSDGDKLAVSHSGIVTTKDLKTGATTASIPGLGDGLKVDPTGVIHAGDMSIRLPIRSADVYGNVTVGGQTVADVPYGSTVTSNGLGLIISDGKNGHAPGKMVLPDGSTAQFNYGSDGKPSDISMSGQPNNSPYVVTLQKTPNGGFTVVTTNSQTKASTSDAYGADRRLVSSKTVNADHTSRTYNYNGQHIASQVDFDGKNTTTKTYTLAGADVSTLSRVDAAYPDGGRSHTTYKVAPDLATSHPDMEVYTNADGSTTTVSHRPGDGTVSGVVAKNAKGKETDRYKYDGSGAVTSQQHWAAPAANSKYPTRKAEQDGGTDGGLSPADARLANSEDGKQDGQHGSLSFNPDGSGYKVTTNPDGTKTSEAFNRLTGHVTLANALDTLPEVVAAFPERFALRYTAMAARGAQQTLDQSSRTGDQASHAESPHLAEEHASSGTTAPNTTEEGSPEAQASHDADEGKAQVNEHADNPEGSEALTEEAVA